MEQQMPKYRKIDMETWPRREHFEYYRNTLQCGYSLTARIDVTNVLRYAKEKSVRIYGCFIFAAARTVNSMDCMRMMVPSEGGAGVWEVSHPSFTIFHKDDETFSDIWTEYMPKFTDFYENYEKVIEKFGEHHGIKARSDQPANFFCISCSPWLEHTGYSTYAVGEPALFPIILFGKYTKSEERYSLPVTVTISHAAADGYHTSMFFKKLQENLDNFSDN